MQTFRGPPIKKKRRNINSKLNLHIVKNTNRSLSQCQTSCVTFAYTYAIVLKTRREEWKGITRCGKSDIFTLKVTKRKENISLNVIPLHTMEGRNYNRRCFSVVLCTRSYLMLLLRYISSEWRIRHPNST
jgi:hypothetical protein